jgi:hypothetical protein
MIQLTPTQWLALIVVAVLVFAGVVALLRARSKSHRHEALQQAFGPEYDRAVAEFGDRERAERELANRKKRVDRLHLRVLSSGDRNRFASEWRVAQERFVDDPSGAVRASDELIKDVMRSVGYPVEDFEQRVADLSVDHARVVQHYRAARVLADANREGRANTEELRQAFIHYRALFADLLEDPATGFADAGAPARA